MIRKLIQEQLNKLIDQLDNAGILDLKEHLSVYILDGKQETHQELFDRMSDEQLNGVKKYIGTYIYELMERKAERVMAAGTYLADVYDWLPGLKDTSSAHDTIILLGVKHREMVSEMEDFWSTYVYEDGVASSLIH